MDIGTQLESTFWISKINLDFPERILPYKNSDFKRIYHTELRRQVLLDKFHFDSKPDLDYDLEYNPPCFGPQREAPEPLIHSMYFDRCVSILSDIIGTRIEYWFELS